MVLKMNDIEIKVVGPQNPCKRCKATKSFVEEAVHQHFTSAQQKHITITHIDVSAPETIEAYGLLDTPAVVINDTVVSEGQIPKTDYIQRKLLEFRD